MNGEVPGWVNYRTGDEKESRSILCSAIFSRSTNRFTGFDEVLRSLAVLSPQDCCRTCTVHNKAEAHLFSNAACAAVVALTREQVTVAYNNATTISKTQRQNQTQV